MATFCCFQILVILNPACSTGCGYFIIFCDTGCNSESKTHNHFLRCLGMDEFPRQGGTGGGAGGAGQRGGQRQGELAAFGVFRLLSGGFPANWWSSQQDVLKRYWAHNPQLLHKRWSTAGSHQLPQSRSSSNRCYQYRNTLALLSLGFCRGRHRLVPHITFIFDSLWGLGGKGHPSPPILSTGSNSRTSFLNMWGHIA